MPYTTYAAVLTNPSNGSRLKEGLLLEAFCLHDGSVIMTDNSQISL